MAYYFCIAIGQADFMPDEQIYDCADTSAEFEALVSMYCARFDEEEARVPYKHAFRAPRRGEDNYSQRLRVARDSDRVLDVIGMTEDEYAREAGAL